MYPKYHCSTLTFVSYKLGGCDQRHVIYSSTPFKGYTRIRNKDESSLVGMQLIKSSRSINAVPPCTWIFQLSFASNLSEHPWDGLQKHVPHVCWLSPILVKAFHHNLSPQCAPMRQVTPLARPRTNTVSEVVILGILNRTHSPATWYVLTCSTEHVCARTSKLARKFASNSSWLLIPALRNYLRNFRERPHAAAAPTSKFLLPISWCPVDTGLCYEHRCQIFYSTYSQRHSVLMPMKNQKTADCRSVAIVVRSQYIDTISTHTCSCNTATLQSDQLSSTKNPNLAICIPTTLATKFSNLVILTS